MKVMSHMSMFIQIGIAINAPNTAVRLNISRTAVIICEMPTNYLKGSWSAKYQDTLNRSISFKGKFIVFEVTPN